MAIDPADEFIFTPQDLEPVLAALDQIVATGSGWMNISPELPPGHEPTRRNLFLTIFSSRGPAVPLITLSPAERGGGRLGLGLQHQGGPAALRTLAGLGQELPQGWSKVADHPRRGLVLSAPESTPRDELVMWMLDAAFLLSLHDRSGDAHEEEDDDEPESDEVSEADPFVDESRWVARVYRG